jgi:hypothetical protein
VTEVGEEVVVVEKRDRVKDMRRASDGELEREGQIEQDKFERWNVGRRWSSRDVLRGIQTELISSTRTSRGKLAATWLLKG